MFSRFLHIVWVLAFGIIFLTGCAEVMFEPKPLEAEARGITIVRSTPYNCKVLGEVEGRDSKDRIKVNGPKEVLVGATQERLRESALNDLRNEAYYAVGEKKQQAMLYIIKEMAICNIFFRGVWQERECPDVLPKGHYNQGITSYIIRAGVYDCGERK